MTFLRYVGCDVTKSSMEYDMTFDPNKPYELRPLPPPIELKDHKNFMEIMKSHNEALQAISQLEGALRDLDNPEMFLSSFYLQESISSNAVENIHTTIESVLEDETKPANERTQENKEVIYYRAALIDGRKSLAKSGLSSRAIKAIHKQLKISKGVPGEYRKVQNAIANKKRNGTEERIYTPPFWQHVEDLIGNWERFASDDTSYFPLIKIAICHYQFEAIHPFEDGNGRTGRILMILQMLDLNLLSYPALFLSGYLSENEDEYKNLLLKVTTDGNWWEYISFMLKGFTIQSLKTRIGILNLKRVKKDLKSSLFNMDSKPIRKNNISAVIDHIFSHPVTHARFMEKDLKIHWQTCGRYLRALTKAGFLTEQQSGKYKFFRNPKAFEAIVVKKK